VLCGDLGALGLVSLCGGELAGDLLGGAVTGGLGKGLYSLVGASEAFSLATASHYKGELKRKGEIRRKWDKITRICAYRREKLMQKQ
jgi:hypothetical protein